MKGGGDKRKDGGGGAERVVVEGLMTRRQVMSRFATCLMVHQDPPLF